MIPDIQPGQVYRSKTNNALYVATIINSDPQGYDTVTLLPLNERARGRIAPAWHFSLFTRPGSYEPVTDTQLTDIFWPLEPHPDTQKDTDAPADRDQTADLTELRRVGQLIADLTDTVTEELTQSARRIANFAKQVEAAIQEAKNG